MHRGRRVPGRVLILRIQCSVQIRYKLGSAESLGNARAELVRTTPTALKGISTEERSCGEFVREEKEDERIVEKSITQKHKRLSSRYTVEDTLMRKQSALQRVSGWKRPRHRETGAELREGSR